MDAFFPIAKPASEWKGSDASNRCQVQAAASGRNRSSRGTRVAAVRPLSVLIVDGNRDSVDTLSMLVQLWGHDATCAYDGAAGLAMAATMPDVVLLDIALRRVDGFQLAVQLRQMAGLKDCLLIAVTGYADEEHRRRSQEAGIDVFLIKPVEAFVLETLLMLERRQLRTLQAVGVDSSDFRVRV